MKRICRYCGEIVYIDPDIPIHCYKCDRDLEPNELISSWSLKARIQQLKSMNELICQANDEGIYYSWIYLMPDEATEEDFKEIALDDEQYNECFDLFVKLIAKKGNRW